MEELREGCKGLGLEARRVSPWRLAFQWSAGLCVLLVPFARVGGESALRLDLPSRSLLLLGRPHPLEEMHLFLPLALTGILAFLLVTATLGRVWCGWACPQTTLADLTDAVARALGIPNRGRDAPRPWRVAALHATYAVLALLISANVVWYFLSPYDFFPLLAAGRLPGPAAAALAAVAGAAYLDLAFVRRTLCRTACPYGRFQAALADAGTLTLRYDAEEAQRCLQCGACVRVCPTGVDIRNGPQIECLQCGRCRDACSRVLARKGERGLIAYTFGEGRRGPRALWSARTVLLLLATLVSAAAFGIAAARWAPVSLTVRRSPAPERRLATGETAVFFEGTLANRGSRPQALRLEAADGRGAPLVLTGPVGEAILSPGERRTVRFALVLPRGQHPREAVLLLRDPEGDALAERRVALPTPGSP